MLVPVTSSMYVQGKLDTSKEVRRAKKVNVWV